MTDLSAAFRAARTLEAYLKAGGLSAIIVGVDDAGPKLVVHRDRLPHATSVPETWCDYRVTDWKDF